MCTDLLERGEEGRGREGGGGKGEVGRGRKGGGEEWKGGRRRERGKYNLNYYLVLSGGLVESTFDPKT